MDFPKITIRAGIACAVFAILAVMVGFWAPMTLSLAGLLLMGNKYHANDEYSTRGAVVIYVLGAAVATVPPDGSWLSWGLTAFVSLGLCLWASTILYYVVLRPRLPRDHHLALLVNIFVSLGLPMLSLTLVQYLIETERPFLSGLILIAVATWLGWRLAPRKIQEAPSETRHGPWGPYQPGA